MGSPEANFIGLQMVVVKLLIYKSREKVGSATGTGGGGGGGVAANSLLTTIASL